MSTLKSITPEALNREGCDEDLPVLSKDRISDARFQFRNFNVMPGERLLLRDGQIVDIGGRAFDLLLVLLESRGAIVSKNEIVDHVWPSTLVDESNLRFQMACLRRALGEDRDVIKTVQGRGYLLVAESSSRWSSHPSGHPAAASPAVGTRADWPAADPIVAVIDDDDDTREALDGLLRSTGLRVEAFASVQAFLDRASPSAIGCLVLDVYLPGRSGLEFQADMVKAGLSLPIIFISGHADVHMSVRAMKAGATEFLTKPVRHEELISAIQEIMPSAAS
jgi:DNA-binding response OmpR family regulator